jgi:hypothetical protein
MEEVIEQKKGNYIKIRTNMNIPTRFEKETDSEQERSYRKSHEMWHIYNSSEGIFLHEHKILNLLFKEKITKESLIEMLTGSNDKITVDEYDSENNLLTSDVFKFLNATSTNIAFEKNNKTTIN